MNGKIERGRISSLQVFFLLIHTIMPTAVLFVPGITVHFAGNDAWLSTLMAGVFGFLVAGLSVMLTRMYPGATVVHIGERMLGKWPGKAIGFLYSFYFLYGSYIIQREFGEFMNTVVLRRTPQVVVIGFLTLLAAYALYMGLEVLARISEFIGLIGILTFSMILLFMIREISLENMLPLFVSSPQKILLGSLAPASWIGECAIIMMFAPFMASPKRAVKATLLCVAVVTLNMTLIVLEGIGMFGGTMIGRMNFPFFSMLMYMEPAEFVERLDPIFIAIWVAGMLVKLCVFYYAGVLGLAQTFGMQTYRPLILPAGLLLTALSLSSWRGLTELLDFTIKVVPPSISFFNLGITLLLFVIAWMKRRSDQNRAAANEKKGS